MAGPPQTAIESLRTNDEVVYDFQQSISCVRIAAISDGIIEIHIITATKDAAEREGYSSWIDWTNAGCPGASTRDTIRCTSDGTIIPGGHNDQRTAWLSTLLSLKRTTVPEHLRKKAGPTPMVGEIDLRATWQPKIVVQGLTLNIPSEAFSLQWPNDGTELSGRTLILYFPKSSEAVPALPYWIESPSSSARVRVVDSFRGPSFKNP